MSHKTDLFSTVFFRREFLVLFLCDPIGILKGYGFYCKKKEPMAEVQNESEAEEEKPAENSTDENAALLAKLLSNPETAALLKALAKTI